MEQCEKCGGILVWLCSPKAPNGGWEHYQGKPCPAKFSLVRKARK